MTGMSAGVFSAVLGGAMLAEDEKVRADKPRKAASKINLDLTTPDKIYSAILGEVDALFKAVTSSEDKSELLDKAKRECRTILSQIEGNVSKKLKDLEINAEWNEFAIAFYGETNAGKSTIIEALRIHLGEASKKREQNEFVAVMAKLGLSRSAFDKAKQAVLRASQQLEAFESDCAELKRNKESELNALDGALADQMQLVVSIKAAAPIWKRLVYLFWAPQEARVAKRVAVQLQSKREETARIFESLKQQRQVHERTKADAEQTLAGMMCKLESLAPLADGSIIGDGQSDFTRETRTFRFDSEHGKFSLLDVPGIEGKEAIVGDEILKAVQKAHAVFYVTSKAAPPQKGDDGQAGTLEKIKAHLNDQTEVWSIFNKRITNPMQLNGELVSDDELVSLNVLDLEMRKLLGKNYAGCFVVAARPAFLAVAECLVPFGPDEKNREKFVAKFSLDKLIERSGMTEFTKKLGKEVLASFPEKIRKSNFTKAAAVLGETICSIKDARVSKLEPLIESLKNAESAASSRLNGALDELDANFIAETDGHIVRFKKVAREKIYKEIDRGISNDEFKDSLEETLRAELPEVNRRIALSAETVFARFEKAANQTIEDYKRHSDELQSIHGRFDGGQFGSGFKLKIEIASGINATELVSALVGGALLWWNPGGWVIIAAGVLTTVFAIAKAVRGFFSLDYKRIQQRQSADSNIRRIAGVVESSASSAARVAIFKIREQIKETEVKLKEPLLIMASVSVALGDSVKSLAEISEEVQARVAA